MQRIITLTLLCFAALTLKTGPVYAIPQFQKVFFEVYINGHEDPEFAEFVKTKVKCLACHQGKKKTHHNAYGEHLEELLDKKEDKKNVEKISAALEQVAELPFDPEDEESETYGERIAAGKLPGADTLDELKAEPEGDEEE